ncbi:26S proteasome non-ATPase regulatory subunit 8 [Papiliotrema laurentii]|uniref:26S proteasome non-ATPase regulatory subunit 8 n=1 Tax=Papiliotrema laurentii TaxID=5418 RepID=A0AAD9FRS1_PAPLA|nr:26S proteasome non-ATPase regulatory subunit 8 [Papiliotrema laurentii]
MALDLQQSLSDLQALLNGDKLTELGTELAKVKIALASSGLYFAPPSANPDDLATTRSILELGVFASLRQQNLAKYISYNSALQPFYDNLASILPPSPNKPVILGLHLLFLLSEGQLTSFHQTLETLTVNDLSDVFIKLAVDLERWLMEGQYNRVYRARDRVPRPEYSYLLDRLVSQVRNQIASTMESSYPSIPVSDAAEVLFLGKNDTTTLHKIVEERGWLIRPGSQTITFPNSPKADIRIQAQKGDANAPSVDVLKGKGVIQGTPMNKMVGPSLSLASQLEMIV